MSFATYAKDGLTVTVTVTDQDSGKPTEGAVIQIKPYGLWGISNDKGVVRISGVPSGKCEIEASMMGYTTKSITANLSKDRELSISIQETTLAIDDVVVVAVGNKAGEATTSTIGRQAIDHLQATSLQDIMQLLPGNIVTTNPSLTSSTPFTNRTADKYDGNNSFGASVIVDGVPISTNANMNVKGGVLSDANSGVDMRSIGTDDIENVQVVRGIASAEYGDMSSGAMMITSKVGVSDLKLRAKIFPGVTQLYAGKGFKLGKGGTLNVNADYATGKYDPRYRSEIYRRTNANVIHSVTLGGHSTFTTKLSTANVNAWYGPDPAEIVQDVYDQTKENGFTLTHGGKFSTDCLFARNLKYDLSVSYKVSDSYSRHLNSGDVPLMDQKTEGVAEAILLPKQYYGCGGTIGKPLNVFAKVSDSFNLNTKDGLFRNRFNLGAEYRIDGNYGIGFYNDDNLLPLSTTGYRDRAFYEIPFMHQVVAYAEDNIDLHLSSTNDYPVIKAQVGLRWNEIQPGQDRQMSSLSPRVNLNFEPARWVSLRAGYGLSEKNPSLLMLYPDVSYYDIKNVDCHKGGKYLGVYTTTILDHTPRTLRPMRNEKIELGVDFRTGIGQTFSIIAYQENVSNGFASTNNEWTSIVFPHWAASDVVEKDGVLTYDKNNPASIDTTLVQVTRTANQEIKVSRGIEYDFNLGKIKTTGTSFYLRGAYGETQTYTSNDSYYRPKGDSSPYPKVYFVYPCTGQKSVSRQFNSSLMVVQSIPRLNFVVSATLQASLYEYSMRFNDITVPIGYINIEEGTEIKPVTEQMLANAENIYVKGYRLSDNIYEKSVYSGAEETWPSLWSANLRVTKDVAKFLGLSFYVNNLLFHQPWQTSSVSSTKVERNSNYFSFGFEIQFKL